MDLTSTDRADIRSVIEQQIQAFRQGNAEAAFAFASPGIQEQFKTPQLFIKMVQTAYDPLYRARSVVFQDIGTVEGKLAQQVVIMGPDEALYRVYYLMQRQSNSDWRINGCYLTRMKETQP
ncbi:MAG: DUF4864 domain-containing protein [Cyanobacteria bacterium P01_A01_bin.135]